MTVYNPLLVASYDTHKWKCCLNSNPQATEASDAGQFLLWDFLVMFGDFHTWSNVTGWAVDQSGARACTAEVCAGAHAN